jgi:F-type H+-transporting ATPase subunit delta
MQAGSRESLAAVREDLAALLRQDGVDLPALADELFGVADLLDREKTLRRALTDPSRSADARAQLMRDVLGSQVSDMPVDLVVSAVRARWSRPLDLADAVELLAVETLVAGAEQAGRLDTVEDELFRAGRIIAGSPQLRQSLGDRAAPVQRRVELAEALFGGKVAEESLRLVRQAVTSPRGRSLDQSLETYAAVAAERRSRLVATVTAAVPLTEQQRDRLSAVLAGDYGHEVHLNVEVDPELIGGLRVEIGDEVIDGSVLARLADARRRLVG